MKFHEIVWGIVACILITMFAINAPAINRRFVAWLSAPNEIECKYIELHKGVKR